MRWLVLLMALGLLAGVFGCGGSGNDGEPRIEDQAANDLADRSALVAQLLDEGKPCAARRQARALAAAVAANRRTGAVPDVLREEIDPVVTSLVAQIRCDPAADQSELTQPGVADASTSEPDADEDEASDSDDKKKDKKDKKDHPHGDERGNGGDDD